jgi:hypothetical protein
VIGTLKLLSTKSMPAASAEFILHTGDISHLSILRFDNVDQILKATTRNLFVPGEHDVLNVTGRCSWNLSQELEGGGWYSLTRRVHFIGLVNVMNLKLVAWGRWGTTNEG